MICLSLSIFPRASEQKVLLIVEVCYTFSSSHPLIFTSHLLIFTSSHLHIFSSHTHIFSSHIFSCPLALLPSCPLALMLDTSFTCNVSFMHCLHSLDIHKRVTFSSTHSGHPSSSLNMEVLPRILDYCWVRPGGPAQHSQCPGDGISITPWTSCWNKLKQIETTRDSE